MKNICAHTFKSLLLVCFIAGNGVMILTSCSSRHDSKPDHATVKTAPSTPKEYENEESQPIAKHEFKNESSQKGERYVAANTDETSNTIFTNPAEDCSSSMNISWLTAPGKLCRIEVIDESDPNTYIYDCEDEDSNYPSDEEKPVEIKTGYAKSDGVLPVNQLSGTFEVPAQGKADENDHDSRLIEKHGYRLFNLKPDTDYSYRIVTYDKNTGKKEHSETHHFHTAGADHWKAAVLGDFHNYTPEPRRLNSAMKMLDVLDSVSGGVDWVLSTGDQTGWGGSLSFWTQLSEQPGYMNHMWAAVEGNHDSLDKYKNKTDSFFRDTHYYPQNGYPGQEGSTYWFKYGDVLFLMLNNEGMLKAGSQKPAIEWMENVIANHPAKYIVVVEHHQWLIGTDGTNGQLDRWKDEFDKLGVDLAISGHNHAYLRTYPLYDRKPVESGKGTYYVVNSSCDDTRGRKLNPLRANADLIAARWSEGSHTVGGMVMDVNPQRIAMTLYDRNGHVEDTFSVPARR